MSDDLNLAEIEARAEAATEGPWQLPVARGLTVTLYGPTIGESHGRPVGKNLGRIHVGSSEYEANATFIAHARTDIPLLIAAIRARDAEIERLKKARFHGGYDPGPPKWHVPEVK